MSKTATALADQALRATRHGKDLIGLVDDTTHSLAAVKEITGRDVAQHLDAVAALQSWARSQTTTAFRQRLQLLDGGAMTPVATSAIAPYNQALSNWRVRYTAQAFEQPPTGPGGVRVIGVVYGHDPMSSHETTSWRLVADSNGPDSRWLGPTADEAFITARDLAQTVRKIGGDDPEVLHAQLWLLHQWAVVTDPDDLDEALTTAQQRVAEATERLQRSNLGAPFLRAVDQLANLTIECSALEASLDPRLQHHTHA
ncbi:hypothetical protein [Luteococcus sp.]|uniref:hypothetical protein n=1 Tax=Luteococcus sp. TaxID=1969402 RepID=UPI0037350549